MDYFYEAVDTTGKVVVGKIEGHDEGEVHRKLQQLGYRARSIAQSRNADDPTVAPFMGIGSVTAAPAPNHATMMMPALTHNNAMALPTPHHGTMALPAQTAPRANVTLAGNAARLGAQQNQTRSGNRQSAATPGFAAGASTLGGVSTRDMMLFFRQLASLSHSGITLYGALDNLSGRTPNKNLAQTVREMADRARNGGSIAEVMDHYPRIYPDNVANVVRAGEQGGFVEIALAEIAQNYEQNIALYRQAWIPKLMATQAFFLLFLVQPLFTTLFSSFDIQANLVLYFQLVLFRNLPIALALFFLIKWGAKQVQLPQYRRWRDQMALKMPPFGDLQRQNAIATFLRMLRRLYHAGVAPINAWEGAMNTAGNIVIREQLASSYELMQRGSSLADAFAATGLFANQVEQMVFTGQESGQVVEMLDQATEYYQEQVEDAHKKSRFMMLRIGILAMLILGGASMLWMVHSYFAGMFHWVDANFGD